MMRLKGIDLKTADIFLYTDLFSHIDIILLHYTSLCLSQLNDSFLPDVDIFLGDELGEMVLETPRELNFFP